MPTRRAAPPRGGLPFSESAESNQSEQDECDTTEDRDDTGGQHRTGHRDEHRDHLLAVCPVQQLAGAIPSSIIEGV